MLENYTSSFRSVVYDLAGYMQSFKDGEGQSPGVVFILGAGCSMQYGLPSFRELLTNIYADYSRQDPEKVWDTLSQDDLRGLLEDLFSRLSADQRRKRIRKFLPRAAGQDCPGYLRLARLHKRGYIRAILNMNFDTLLEDACKALKHRPRVLYKASEMAERPIYKVHGSISKGRPTIAIAESDLFRERSEETATVKLLTQNHVAILGYSGVDAKITQALRAFPPKADPEDMKLFVVNVAGPGVYLAQAMGMRASETLRIGGPEASFENFMEALEYTLSDLDSAGASLSKPDPHQRRVPAYFTNAELRARDECRKLAISIRATINVAEASPVGIVDHGEDLFELCLKLAGCANVSLTSPEKYLILCAGYLHDLGYFLGYSGTNATENPGWKLLRFHGEKTKALLQNHLTPEWRDRITPFTYSEASRKRFVELLIRLCDLHSVPPKERVHEGATLQGSASECDPLIEINGIPIRVRFDLVDALFTAAEELAEGHPFLPSADPIDAEPNGKRWTLEDPILDLYLHRKGKELHHAVSVGRVEVEPEPGSANGMTATAAWLLTLASKTIECLDQVTRQRGGRGVRFVCCYAGQLPLQERNEVLIQRALEESLSTLVQGIEPGSPGELASILDLLALYTLGHPDEPRVDLERSPVVRNALPRIQSLHQKEGSILQQSTLPWYFLIDRTSGLSPMEKAFEQDFHRILYPAWRHCARSLREGVDAICLTRLVLDLGSTPFRGEVAFALRHLSAEKMQRDNDKLIVHEGCALCTSRLLYIFSYARLLFGDDEPSSLSEGDGRSLDDMVHGLLRTMLCKSPRPNWWGFTRQSSDGCGIHSADYAAWAVRSLAFCLAVDQEIRDRTEKPWLSNRREVIDLLEERLSDLCEAACDDLLTDLAEEPHTYIAGDVAVTLLQAEKLLRGCPDMSLDWRSLLKRARTTMKLAVEELDKRSLPLISKLYLWPAKMYLRVTSEDEEEQQDLERELMHLYRRCSGNPIWIPSGAGAGSWGYNVENTQRLISALNTFWCCAFENREVFEPLFVTDKAFEVAPPMAPLAARPGETGEPEQLPA